MSERFVEYVVVLDEGPFGVRGFQVRGVFPDGGGEIVWGELDYDVAIAYAQRLNREELGITVFPGPKQIEDDENMEDELELRKYGIVDGCVTEERKRELRRLEEEDDPSLIRDYE